MAEARREEEEEGQRRDLRDVRNRNQTTGMFGNVPDWQSSDEMNTFLNQLTDIWLNKNVLSFLIVMDGP